MDKVTGVQICLQRRLFILPHNSSWGAPDVGVTWKLEALDEVSWLCVNLPSKSWQAKFIFRLLQALSKVDNIPVSVCVCVCLAISTSQPSGPECWMGREEEEADIWLELAEPGDVCGAWGSCTVTLWIPAGKRHSTGIGAELLLHMKPRTDGSFQLQTDSNSQNWIVCYLFFLTSVKVTTITGKHYPSSRYFSSTLPARTICNHNFYDRALPCQLSPKKDALVTRAT